MGFTEHDADLVYAGVTYLASSGFTASKFEQSLGLSIDNLEATGALSSAAITEADILAGRYDGAAVDLFWVNWADMSMGEQIASGNLGELKRQGVTFQAEFRSLANRLNQQIGRTFGRLCDAQLGDARCKVDLTAPQYRTGCTLAGGTGRVLTVAGLSGFASDWFTAGTLAVSSGVNDGLVFEVKSHRRTAGVDEVELWLPPPFPFAAGDAGTIVAGCRKTLAVCRSKFSNVPNFRGFPHIPGSDAVTRYGVQGALNATGGSLFA